MIACLESFQNFLPSADFFSKYTFSKNTFMNPIRVSNSLDPNQDRWYVVPDLDSYRLQGLLEVDDKTGHWQGKIRVLVTSCMYGFLVSLFV